MVRSFREEFRLKCISLNHENYSSFAQSKWMSPIPYLVYRWVVALFFVIHFLLERNTFHRWYTGYFTGWGMATICFYTSLYAILASYHHYRSRKHANISMVTHNNNSNGTNKEIHDVQCNTDNRETELIEYKDELHPGMVWGYKILWMLFNVAAVNSFIVTLGYWSVLHSSRRQKYLVGIMGFHNITAHLLNALVMFVEVCITPFPIRLLHVLYSNLYGILYIAASIIFWLTTGKIFYQFLDYSNHPGLAAITVVVGFGIAQPLVQLLYYGVYRLRERLLTMMARDREDEPTDKITEC